MSIHQKPEMRYEQEELDSLFALGILYYQIGQWDNARVIFEGLCSLNVIEKKASLMMGELFLVSGEYEAAIAHYKKCLAKEDSLDFLLGLSRAYLMADRNEKARFCLTEILENAKLVDPAIVKEAEALHQNLQKIV